MSFLNGQIVLVTGASRGIGLAIARAAGHEGAKLILVARDRKALARAAADIPESHPIAADVSSPREVERLFASVRRRLGRLDVLVNNAGVFTYKPFLRTTLEDWRANLDTNLTSLYLATRAALPLLGRSRAAHIVNILSVASRQPFAKCSAYCAAKFGARGFTQVLAEELRPQRVRVTAILPGMTDTRMMKEFDFPVKREDLIQPEDVASAVLDALRQPARTTLQEIVLTPTSGAL